MIIFDKFQPNFLEMDGKIVRNPFQFIGDSCKVWHDGQEIFQTNSKIKISATLSQESLLSASNHE